MGGRVEEKAVRSKVSSIVWMEVGEGGATREETSREVGVVVREEEGDVDVEGTEVVERDEFEVRRLREREGKENGLEDIEMDVYLS